MKRFFLVAAVAAALTAVPACQKFDDVDHMDARRQNSMVRPPQQVADQMPQDRTAVPADARDVEWDREGQYWVLSYEIGHGADETEYEVWFDADGKWVMSMNDIRFSDVPQQIKDYLEADPVCSKAVFDRDGDYIEKASGVSYRFDAVADGVEYDVEVTADGVITVKRDR